MALATRSACSTAPHSPPRVPSLTMASGCLHPCGPSTQIVVTVPEGAVAGQSRIVNSPNGGKLRVNIPAGVVAGQKMRVWQAGMFGRGIYFAGCPLKSLQYSRSTPRQNLAPWAPLLASRGGADGTADAPQLMLLCDVELGQPLYERTRPRPDLDRASLVRAHAAPVALVSPSVESPAGDGTTTVEGSDEGATRSTQHARDLAAAEDARSTRDAGLSTGFDSLVATTVVRVPEYVVYTPEQSAPRYVLEVRELPRLPMASSGSPPTADKKEGRGIYWFASGDVDSSFYKSRVPPSARWGLGGGDSPGQSGGHSPQSPATVSCLVVLCVSLLCGRHRPSRVHPYRVGVPVVGRTVFQSVLLRGGSCVVGGYVVPRTALAAMCVTRYFLLQGLCDL